MTATTITSATDPETITMTAHQSSKFFIPVGGTTRPTHSGECRHEAIGTAAGGSPKISSPEDGSALWASETLPMPLAGVASGGNDFTGWAMSEKLDGVRAIWDGETLRTKNGNTIHAPAWWLAGLPPIGLTGELWGGRGTLQATAAAVRRKTPITEEWEQIKLAVFDVESLISFPKRLDNLEQWFLFYPYFFVIPQFHCTGNDDANRYFQQITKHGGEGVILRDTESGAIVKLKPEQDDEGEVLANELTENGGHIVVCWNGLSVHIGSGIPAEVRANPPAIGEKITFAYSGLTSRGLPRSPRFKAIRNYE